MTGFSPATTASHANTDWMAEGGAEVASMHGVEEWEWPEGIRGSGVGSHKVHTYIDHAPILAPIWLDTYGWGARLNAQAWVHE